MSDEAASSIPLDIFKPEVMQATKELHLNLWGQIHIAMYDEETIRFGLHKTSLFKDAQDPFRYFLSQCNVYCKTSGNKKNYQLSWDLQVRYKMPADTDIFVDKKPVVYKSGTTEKLTAYKKSNVYKKGTAESVHKPTEFYNIPEVYIKKVTTDFDQECSKWHEMVMRWDSIEDPNKKCVKGYELAYPGYIEWLKKNDLMPSDISSMLTDVDTPIGVFPQQQSTHNPNASIGDLLKEAFGSQESKQSTVVNSPNKPEPQQPVAIPQIDMYNEHEVEASFGINTNQLFD